MKYKDEVTTNTMNALMQKIYGIRVLFDADDEDELGLARDSALIIASRKTAENIISAITSTW